MGNYQNPLIYKQDIDLDTISLISFSDTKHDGKENAYKTVHFFTCDWMFDKVYEKAADCAEKLKQYYVLLSPGVSMFTDMPKALLIIIAWWQGQAKFYMEKHTRNIIQK